MGWWLSQAANLPTPATPVDQSLTTALIYVLGTVVVALITIGLPLLFKSRQVDNSPDPKVGETVAVVASRQVDDRRTLAQLDRHVDGQGEQIDQLRWEFDDLKARFDEHRRRHGEP